MVPQEAGNDFRLADWRMDLLEELFAENENALGLRCPAAVVIAQFIGGGMEIISWRLSMCEEAHYVYMPKTDH